MNISQTKLQQTTPRHIPSVVITIVVAIAVVLLHIAVLYWFTHLQLQITHYPISKTPFVRSAKAIKIELINLPKDKPRKKSIESSATAQKQPKQTSTQITTQTTAQTSTQQAFKTSRHSDIVPNTSTTTTDVNTEIANKSVKDTSEQTSDRFMSDDVNNHGNHYAINNDKMTDMGTANKEINQQNTDKKSISKQKISPTGIETETEIETKTESESETVQQQAQPQTERQPEENIAQTETIKPLTIEETRTIIEPVIELNTEVSSESRNANNTETLTTIETENESNTSQLTAIDKRDKIATPPVEDELFSQYYRANKRSIAKVYDGSDGNTNLMPIEVGLEVSATQALEHLLEPIFLDDLPVTKQSIENQSIENQSFDNQPFDDQSFSEQDKLTVYLFFYVDTLGNVMSNPEPFIDRSSGNAEIDNQALAVILSAKFKPFERNGKPVVAQVAMPLSYRVVYPSMNINTP